jgi:hypothetical protein
MKPTSNLRFINRLINRSDGLIKVKVLQQWWSTRDSQFDEEDIALDTNGEWRDVRLESE